MSGERILVIDDGADMREFVIDYVLKPNGFTYSQAKDGLEGFETILSEKPDLIVLDLQMPRLDGIGLLKKMREEDIHIPVVLMTFYGSEEIAIEVFRLGVRDYVIKPFTDDELLDAIERALVETRLRRERDELERRLIETNRRLKQQIQDYGYILGLAAHLGHSDTYTIMTLLEGCAGQIGAKSLCLYLYQAGSLAESAAFGGTQADVQAVASHIARTRSAEAFQQSDELAAVGVPVLWHDRMMGILIADIPSDRVARHHLVMLQALADYLSVLVQRNNRGLDLH